jgi:hypothetical protein
MRVVTLDDMRLDLAAAHVTPLSRTTARKMANADRSLIFAQN